MGKILESPKEGIIAKALLMGPIVCDAQDSILPSMAHGDLIV